MKIIINIVLCVIISILTSTFLPSFNPGKDAITTLFTISGIMFSIGMSLCVISITSGVKNAHIKKRIRGCVDFVRNQFILCFGITSFLFVVFFSDVETNKVTHIYENWQIKHSHVLVFFICYSIIYFIFNFLSLQKLNKDIEDTISEE